MKPIVCSLFILLFFIAFCAIHINYHQETLAAVEPITILQGTQKPADFAPYMEMIKGTRVTFNMVPINGGTFTMGSSEQESGHAADESPDLLSLHHHPVANLFFIKNRNFIGDSEGKTRQKPNTPLQLISD